MTAARSTIATTRAATDIVPSVRRIARRHGSGVFASVCCPAITTSSPSLFPISCAPWRAHTRRPSTPRFSAKPRPPSRCSPATGHGSAQPPASLPCSTPGHARSSIIPTPTCSSPRAGSPPMAQPGSNLLMRASSCPATCSRASFARSCALPSTALAWIRRSIQQSGNSAGPRATDRHR